MKLKRQKSLVDEMERSFLEEAKQIEDEIEDVQLEEDPIDKEKLRTAILTEGIETEQKENPKPKKKSMPRKIGQWAAMLVLCLVGIFGFSMTSQGNRVFLVNKVEEFFGKKTDVRMDNKNTLVLDRDEEKARDDIEKTLMIEVPEFYYMPDQMHFLEYEVFIDSEVATMYYQYGEKVISFYMSSNNKESVENNSIDGELTDQVNLVRDNIQIDIWTLSNDVNNEKAYCAQWLYKNTYYSVQGYLDLKDFKKFIENIVY